MRSSAPTGPRCRAIDGGCWRSSRSSTWRARSSASAASARARSSSCSRGATKKTRCSCRSRKRPRSVLEDHLPRSRHQPGSRVVHGQRMMQAASDIYLGWTKGVQAERYLYWRQLRDMKGSAVVEGDDPVRAEPSTRASAAGRSPAPTLVRATRSRSPRTSARAMPSSSRSQTSPRGTQTRTSGITKPSATRSGPDGWRRSRTSEPHVATGLRLPGQGAPRRTARRCGQRLSYGRRQTRGGLRRGQSSSMRSLLASNTLPWMFDSPTRSATPSRRSTSITAGFTRARRSSAEWAPVSFKMSSTFSAP